MSRPTGAAVTQPLSTDERAELERLRALVAAQATADPTDPATPAGTAGGGPRSTRGRWAGSIVLMLLVIGLTFIQFKWVERRVHYN